MKDHLSLDWRCIKDGWARSRMKGMKQTAAMVVGVFAVSSVAAWAIIDANRTAGVVEVAAPETRRNVPDPDGSSAAACTEAQRLNTGKFLLRYCPRESLLFVDQSSPKSGLRISLNDVCTRQKIIPDRITAIELRDKIIFTADGFDSLYSFKLNDSVVVQTRIIDALANEGDDVLIFPKLRVNDGHLIIRINSTEYWFDYNLELRYFFEKQEPEREQTTPDRDPAKDESKEKLGVRPWPHPFFHRGLSKKSLEGLGSQISFLA